MNKLGLIGAMALVFAVGCDKSTTGGEGNIIFTPTNCGLYLGCAFADGLAVGGATDIYIMGTEGVSTAGVTLEVEDPTVAEIVVVPDMGGRPTWELVGLSPGVARVIAYDANDEQIDFVEVGVQQVTALTLDSILGTAVGPSDDPVYDEVYSVNADQNYAFRLRGFVGSDRDAPDSEIMGRFVVDTTVDPAMVGDVDPISELEQGYIQFNVAPGDYVLGFDAGPDAGSLSVLIQAL